MLLLEQAIYRTVAYFDIFGYPLTLLELHRWLFFPNGSATIAEISQVLQGQELKDAIELRDGFVMLRGRSELVAVRHERYVIAQRKFAIARMACRWLRLVGFIRGVAVCNNLGYSNATAESDVDVVVLAAPGRLWLVRLWTIMVTTLLGVRLHSTVKRDKVCLSFYVTSDARLASVALSDPDIYLIYWLATLTPLYGATAWKRWLHEHETWLQQWLPNSSTYSTSKRRGVSDSLLLRRVKHLGEWSQGGAAGGILERAAEQLQRRHLLPALVARAESGDRAVVLSDTMLKFHLTDRRADISEQWRQRLKHAMLSV